MSSDEFLPPDELVNLWKESEEGLLAELIRRNHAEERRWIRVVQSRLTVYKTVINNIDFVLVTGNAGMTLIIRDNRPEPVIDEIIIYRPEVSSDLINSIEIYRDE